MLYLIAAGLWSHKDVTKRGLEAIEKCDILYMDTYTSVWGNIEEFEQVIGKSITKAGRSSLEEDVGKIIDQAKDSDVGILIPGDPMVATTHTTIVNQARKEGVDVKIIHGPSIISAIAESGLHIYKFGKTVSIPFPQKGFHPETFYDNIAFNMNEGLHTLILLDIQDGNQMPPSQAVSILEEIEKKRKEDVIGSAKIVICSFKDETLIKYESAETIRGSKYPQPCCMIITGKLHSTEEEFLESFN